MNNDPRLNRETIETGQTAGQVAALFDPDRLRKARYLARRTQAEAAAATSVSTEAISQFERGVTTPSASTISELAATLHVPVGFFAADPTEHGLDEPAPFFRSLRSAPVSERRHAAAVSHLLWRFVKQLRTYVDLPSYKLHQSPITMNPAEMDIEQLARVTRDYLRVPPGPVENMTRLMERNGIVLARSMMLTDKLDAFCVPYVDQPVVVLGSDKGKRDRSRFDAAHELGHLILHRRVVEHTLAVEKQAHTFAAAFLMPANEIEDELPSDLDWQEFLYLKGKWGVSIASLLYRAKTLKRFDPELYVRSMKYVSYKGWRKNEPGDLGAPEKPQLLAKAVSTLDRVGVSLESIAREAQIPLEPLKQVLGETIDRSQPVIEI